MMLAMTNGALYGLAPFIATATEGGALSIIAAGRTHARTDREGGRGREGGRERWREREGEERGSEGEEGEREGGRERQM